MELMTGGELYDKLVAESSFSEVDARTSIKALIDAIRYCHGFDIIHRDIKLENLLIGRADIGVSSLKVADFGMARQIAGMYAEDRVATTTCGSPGYVAPEVLRKEKYGKECDYWSIGVVCYSLLSGTMPFFSKDEEDDVEELRLDDLNQNSLF